MSALYFAAEVAAVFMVLYLTLGAIIKWRGRVVWPPWMKRREP